MSESDCKGSDCSVPAGGWCRDPLWDSQVSWDTEDPDFSVCLQKTLLLWLPCVFLWLAAPVQAWRLYKSNTRLIPHTPLNIIRTVLAGGLTLLAAADLGYWASRDEYSRVDLLDPILRGFTWVLVLIIIQGERMKGHRSSGLLWTFFFFYTLASLPRFYSQIKREYSSSSHRTELISNTLTLTLSVSEWFLGFFLDAQPSYHGSDVNVEEKNPSPEISATFPSRLVFGWFDSFAWMGYKRSIVKEDLWALNSRDRSSTVVPAFNKNWEPLLLGAKLEQVTEKPAGEAGEAAFVAGGDSVEIVSPPGKSGKRQLTPREKLSIFGPMVKTFGVSFCLGSFLKLFHDMMVFVSPILLRKIINFSEHVEEPVWQGILYCSLLLLTTLVQSVLLSQYFYRMYLVGMWTKSSLISAIYRKNLRVTPAAKKDTTSGEIVNLMSVDCQRISDMVPYLNMLWSAPVQITVAIYMLYQILGPSVFAGLAVMIVLIPINGFIAAYTKKLHVRMMKEKDTRVKKMNELLQGMKILKLYAWEQSFMDEVEIIRNKEISIMMKMAYLSAGTSFIWSCAPFVVSLVTFATYVLSDPENVLNSEKAFTSLALFNILRFPLSMLPMMISGAVQASVSVKRINKFMRNQELDQEMVQRETDGENAIEITDGTFRWDAGEKATDTTTANKDKKTKGKKGEKKEVTGAGEPGTDTKANGKEGGTEEEQAKMLQNGATNTAQEKEKEEVSGAVKELFSLRNINMSVPKGSLCAVVGSVGTGKSSLLSALLGEMEKLSGQIRVSGRIAYVSQQAWIQNAQLKDNILFGFPMQPDKYKKVIDDCTLESDIEILPAGDTTEIGEKGINLSGGQKLRVALARAVYSDADLYLMDDPLSAVDSHVGKHIFDHVLGPNGSLADKTRVLVTHAVTFLPQMDQIIVLKNGEVSEVGTYRELLAQKGAFAEFLVQYISEKGEGEDPEFQSIKLELQSQYGQEELRKQISRVRSESVREESSGGETAAGIVSGGGGISQQRRRGSDQSVKSNGALSTHSASPAKSFTKSPEKEVTPERKAEEKNKQVQYQEEKTETGKVSWRIYLIYFRNMGYFLFTACTLLYALYQFFTTFSSIWLSFWSDNRLPFQAPEDTHHHPAANTTTSPEEGLLVLEGEGGVGQNLTDQEQTDRDARRDLYLGVYGATGLAQAVGAVFASLLLYLSTLAGAKSLHSKTLLRIMHSPMAFFDTTPQGRIINRFSKDVDVLDTSMPMILRGWITCLLQVIATFLVIMYTTPPAIIFIFVVLVGYYFVQRVYVAASRQLKRLDSVAKSPIYSHFGETISGASVIRAYGLQELFIRESEKRVDENHKATFAGMISNRWLAVRLETVGNLIIFASAMFAVLAREQLSAGLVGLSVSFALQVTQTLNWLVRMASDVETNIVAVERLDEYSQLETEAEWDNEATNPPAEWPAAGTISLNNYSTRYRPGLDLVLKNVSVEFRGGERVGIVGRTGAGKSSLTLALFRLIEPAGGSIFIDGVDVGKLGLHRLRSRLTIIPQDPVLFSGTLRHNLDPFSQYEDEAVWGALRHSHLADFVSGLPSGLQHEISEGGENLSVGQRQLICLARALLRKTKILVLDEATAGVDLETDDLIQTTIRAEFKDCTIITIAHRLNTVLDYDRILVLKEGQVAELDAPQVLMHKEGSLFRSMCQDAGIA